MLQVVNGEDAIEVFQKSYNEIDLVILDMIMHKKSGKDTFYSLRKIKPNINIILISGYSINNEVQTLLDEGDCIFLPKPFTMEILKSKIDFMSQLS